MKAIGEELLHYFEICHEPKCSVGKKEKKKTMTLKKIIGLDEWKLDQSKSDCEIMMETSIYLQYPEISNLIHLLPSDRKKKIDLELAGKFEKFIQAFPQIVYQRIGTKKRPRGIHASISLDEAKLIAESDIVNSIFVKDIHQARKKRVRSSQCFFCVKMTVAIQIEGLEKGLQTYEQRLVLIRAKSEQDAYSKLEQQREVYGKPYLNSDGRQVRWMIESLDDCYAIDVSKLSDFIHPSGVEVFSKLKTRKLTRERIWDGR